MRLLPKLDHRLPIRGTARDRELCCVLFDQFGNLNSRSSITPSLASSGDAGVAPCSTARPPQLGGPLPPSPPPAPFLGLRGAPSLPRLDPPRNLYKNALQEMPWGRLGVAR